MILTQFYQGIIANHSGLNESLNYFDISLTHFELVLKNSIYLRDNSAASPISRFLLNLVLFNFIGFSYIIIYNNKVI